MTPFTIIAVAWILGALFVFALRDARELEIDYVDLSRYDLDALSARAAADLLNGRLLP